VGGTASKTIKGLLSGQTISASYPGDANFLSSAGSVSPTISFDHTMTGSLPGNYTFSGGTWLLSSASVTGALSIAGGTSVAIVNSRIGSSLTATNPGSVFLCSSSIGSSVNVTGASGFVLIGDPGDDACGGNTIGSSLVLQNDSGGVEVSHNPRISSSVSLLGDSGGGPFAEDTRPEVEANTINSSLSCSGDTPTATNDGQPNTVYGARSGECGAAGF
jgi:hypothetical protein